MPVQKDLESKMDDVLVKNAPFQIPENGRKALVEYGPYISLIGGILALVAALLLWNAGHAVVEISRSYNNAAVYYGAAPYASAPELGIFYYAALLGLLAQGALMIYAFFGLQARSKRRGWNLLFYGVLANMAYAIVVSLTDQGNIGNVISALITTSISLYLLAQIRHYYNGHHHRKATK